MNTDRELLENAAKAAGYHWPLVWPNPSPVDVPHDWNPLTDDGDALRLAVKLRLEMSWWKDAITVETDNRKASSGILKLGGDPYAATRRAIVRAAAEIGKGMA